MVNGHLPNHWAFEHRGQLARVYADICAHSPAKFKWVRRSLISEIFNPFNSGKPRSSGIIDCIVYRFRSAHRYCLCSIPRMPNHLSSAFKLIR